MFIAFAERPQMVPIIFKSVNFSDNIRAVNYPESGVDTDEPFVLHTNKYIFPNRSIV